MNTVTVNDIIHGDRWTGDSNLLRHKPRVRVRDFPSPFDFQEREPVTLVELRMRFFSGKVHQKPRWWEKINDPAIAAKWRAEMVEHDRLQVELFWGSEKHFDIRQPGEKRWPRDPMTQPSAASMVYESQILIPPTVKSALVAAVSSWRTSPRTRRIGTPDRITRFSTSSIGRSHVADGSSSLEEYLAARPDFSRTTQKSGRVRPLGYINSLDPIEHWATYGTISLVLLRFIPLFEQVTSDAVNIPRPHVTG
ncbi:hypothetical protein OH76DRAFT_1485045 [Lentinus brumalis]|uniref:DUF4246 domain-containing protein n=1 Tax=Lentinus brumalis TaxID=2498619 RepID=A0A371D361_9APHY|nr:hypothetical protein OH76DRAFT_1485045 [Polyporus brumalis]